jgi:hypothetical protein
MQLGTARGGGRRRRRSMGSFGGRLPPSRSECEPGLITLHACMPHPIDPAAIWNDRDSPFHHDIIFRVKSSPASKTAVGHGPPWHRVKATATSLSSIFIPTARVRPGITATTTAEIKLFLYTIYLLNLRDMPQGGGASILSLGGMQCTLQNSIIYVVPF